MNVAKHLNSLTGTALALALVGCGDGGPLAQEADSTEVSVPSPEAGQTVVRDRIVFEGSADQTFRLSDEPFSHMARRWHAYPFTVYRSAPIRAKLTTSDPEMATRASVSIFGPLHEGDWGKPRAAITNERGEVVLPTAELTPGRYVVVVGPKDANAFPNRYPADIGVGTYGDGNAAPLYFFRKDDAWHAFDEGRRLRVISPLPGNHADEDPAGGDVFELEDENGERVTWQLEDWSKSTRFVRDDATDSVGDVGNYRDGLLDIDRIIGDRVEDEEKDRYVVLEAVSVAGDASVNPDMLRVAPSTLDGRVIVAVPSADCVAGTVCNEARYADDDSVVSGARLADAAFGFKPTFYDPGETSTYALEVHCERGCAPPPAERLSATRYPVYYAHGFNSSGETWEDLLETYVLGVPGMPGWTGAEDVEPHSPVEIRAETLRRNIAQMLRDTEANEGIRTGERFLKVNVVAHSMGGLDTRFLLGHDKYNARCEESQCTDANGQAESCCAPPDIDGNPTTWSERIVSLTTLSTPHCGTSFADLGVKVLKNRLGHAGFELVADKFLGLDEAGTDALEQTLFALSQQFCAEYMGPNFPPPNPDRVYTSQDGALPAPADKPTLFSFAGMTCVSGSCGDTVDPGLLPSYMHVKNKEGENDGIVSVKSAQFGIFMGVLPHDHFDWTRTDEDSRLERWGGRLAGWLYGVRKEPSQHFHLDWLDRLREAGY